MDMRATALAFLALAGCVEGPDDDAIDASDASILNLKSDDPAVRDEAERNLMARGAGSLRALERARDSDDPEVRARAERILRELRTPAIETLPLHRGVQGAGQDRLFAVVPDARAWADLVDAFRQDPEEVATPDFDRKTVLLLIGGWKPNLFCKTAALSAELQPSRGILAVRFKDGRFETEMPAPAMPSHTHAVQALRRVRSRLELVNVDAPKDVVVFDLAAAEALGRQDAETLRPRLAELPRLDPALRRAVVRRWAELGADFDPAPLCDRLSVETDPFALDALFDLLATRRTERSEKLALESARRHPCADPGVIPSIRSHLFRTSLKRYLEGAVTPEGRTTAAGLR